jgi:BirA family biotin operon repressor/biotin-[acetyl-CoA-carboxylase] ligase
LGIGINIRVDFTGTPLENIAISLEDFTQKSVNRLEVLAQLLKHIDKWYDHLTQPLLIQQWRAWLSTLGKTVKIQTHENGTIEGIATDVTDSGALLVTNAQGEVQSVFVGDVLHTA